MTQATDDGMTVHEKHAFAEYKKFAERCNHPSQDEPKSQLAAVTAERDILRERSALTAANVHGVIYDCCHSLSQPSMEGMRWGQICDYIQKHVAREFETLTPEEPAT